MTSRASAGAAAFAGWDPDLVVTDPDVVAAYAGDATPAWMGATGAVSSRAHPAGVLLPRTTEDVAAMVRAAAAAGVPLVPRGAGSGLVGGVAATGGALVLSTHRLAAIREVDAEERLAVVQPGVITGDLRRRVAEAGLFYPPDPGSVDFCTIGGNVATDAGGMCCVKYGVTGDFVLALEAVLADGTVVRTGRRTAKGVAGYDLTGLLVGSEGTLAIITEVTLRLLPAVAEPLTAVATFATLGDAAGAVATLTRSGVVLSAMEIMDRTTLRAVADLTGMDLGDSAAMLLVQADDAAAPTTLARAAAICEDAGSTDVAVADDPAEGRALMEARRQALPALERLGSWLLDDVCVPRSRVVELMGRIESIAAGEPVTVGVFGHAGDGNLHPALVHDGSPAGEAAVRRVFDAITAAALDLGGTVTGEHGIGRLKRDWLAREVDPGALAMMRAVKAALDPRGILNPGAVL